MHSSNQNSNVPAHPDRQNPVRRARRTLRLQIGRAVHVPRMYRCLARGHAIMDAETDTYNCLHQACHGNDVATAILILDRGRPHVNVPTSLGFTPLMFAAKQTGLRLVRLLLSRGARLGSANIRGCTALMAASNSGLREMTELLVEKGADLEAWDIDGRTALHFAAREQHVGVLQALLDAGASLNKRMADGLTPLHMACEHGNVRIIELLVDAGAEAGAESVDKRVPLVVASHHGHHDAVRFMISHVGLASCGGDTGGVQALVASAQRGHVEVVRVLTDSGVRDTGGALVGAVAGAYHGCVKLLLRQYENLTLSHINSATDAKGCTALRYAAGTSSKMFQWLLETGADATDLYSMGSLHSPPTLVISVLLIGAKTESDKKLKAVRRILLQVPARRSVSWAWEQRATASTRRILPIAVPVVRRGRRETSRVVLGGLMRYSHKLGTPFLG